MKKILIFSLDYYPGLVSGAEAAIKEITDRIDDIEFHMVTLYYDSNLPRVEKIDNVLVHRVGIFGKPDPDLEQRGKFPLHYNKHYFQFAAAIKGLMLHRKFKYDGIWAMMAHGAGVPASIFKIVHPNMPYALTLEEGDPPEHIERVMKPLWPLFKRAFTKADAVQSISKFLGAWAERMGYEGEIEYIANGANPGSIHPTFDEKEVEQVKKDLHKKEGDVFLLNTARLVHQKGWETTIAALMLLPDNVKLIIVGGGSDEEKLKEMVKELKLEDRVVFTGQKDRSEIPPIRKACDIFVGPSRSEGLGNAFLSAMAAELPVVATTVGGLEDYIHNNETAFAIEPDNPKQIAEKVTYIMENPKEVEKITKAARAMVLEKYDWDKIAVAVRERVFGKILK